MSQSPPPRVHLLGTVQATSDFLDLVADRLGIAGVIGLTQRQPGDGVSGYTCLESQALRHGIPFIGVDSYALTAEADRARLLGLDIELLIVLGWQRLIPSWLIGHCRLAAVGAHGSAAGITLGRGRSPQNWAIMMGAKHFELAIFLIDADADSGPVISSRIYPIEPDEDIASSYAKMVFLVADMVMAAIDGGSINRSVARPQPAGARYLPQRLPEDGAIDWARSPAEICRFIRALTKPYPGAYCSLAGTRLRIWRARPFNPGEPTDRPPGEIIMTLASGGFIVAVGAGGMVIVDDYQAETAGVTLRRSQTLSSVNHGQQLRGIIARHTQIHADGPLSSDILAEAQYE